MSLLEKVETALIFVALLSLWPWITGHRPSWYGWVLVGVLLIMLAVAVRRILALRREVEQRSKDP